MQVKPYIKYPNPIHANTNTSYLPTQVAQAYNFPVGHTGKGQTIGFIELGGAFNQTDLNSYFSQLGLNVKPIKFVSVDGAQNSSDDADGEVMLDLCVALACAPDAQGVIYRAPNSDQGFIHAIQQMITDGVNIISISWGGPERSWSQSTVNTLNGLFQKAQQAGITVFVASGDSGSSDGITGNNVDFPASSPYVVGCGGTSLSYNGTKINSEVVWNDGTQGGATGGGLSILFNLPTWQKTTIQTTTRVVPDLAGNADPSTGYKVIIDGQIQVVGGTSAVAPLMAGLCARINEAIGKPLGFINDKIYTFANVFRDIVSGNNGTYVARVGPDPCTGIGVPDGTKVLAALQVSPPTPPPVTQPPVTTNDYIVRYTNGILSVDGYRLTKLN